MTRKLGFTLASMAVLVVTMLVFNLAFDVNSFHVLIIFLLGGVSHTLHSLRED